VRVLFTSRAWDDYLSWQKDDRKTLRRINVLIADIARNGYAGIGKPEELRHSLVGFWSRRIDQKHRLI
jgi:toxin YoeB